MFRESWTVEFERVLLAPMRSSMWMPESCMAPPSDCAPLLSMNRFDEAQPADGVDEDAAVGAVVDVHQRERRIGRLRERDAVRRRVLDRAAGAGRRTRRARSAVPGDGEPAAAPVLLSTIPFAAPLAEMLRKVRSSAWMVVFWTLSAVPVVVVSVLFGAVAPLVSVTATLPLTVALKAVLAPVEAVMPPSKRTRPVPLVDRLMPVRGVGDEAVDVDGAAVAVGDLDRAGRGAGGGERWRRW